MLEDYVAAAPLAMANSIRSARHGAGIGLNSPPKRTGQVGCQPRNRSRCDASGIRQASSRGNHRYRFRAINR